jgi:hypothetical protein
MFADSQQQSLPMTVGRENIIDMEWLKGQILGILTNFWKWLIDLVWTQFLVKFGTG